MSNYYNDNPSLKFQLQHPLMDKVVKIRENNFSEKDIYDYAPQNFEDAVDNYDKVMEIVGDICGELIAKNAESVDLEGPQIINGRVKYAKGTAENYKALKDANLMGITLQRKYNGLNFPLIPFVMSNELISRADASFSNIWGLQDCAETINEFGSDEIKNIFLPRFNKGDSAAMDLTEPDAGSDLQAVQLKATLNETNGKWYLNGVKRFITNGDADIALVLARSEEGTNDARGLSLFVYDKKDDAVTVRRIENKLGIKGSPTCELVFKNAPALLLGDRKFGLIKYVMSLMNAARIGVSAQAVGIAEAAYREAFSYAHDREQFGKAIINFPAVYEMVAMMRAKTDAARAMLYETSYYVEIYKGLSHLGTERALTPEERAEIKKYQKLSDVFTPLTKLFATEYANEVAYDSLQVHGGSGFMKDYPIQRLYRDARITNIYEGTSQLQVVAAIKGVANGAYIAWIEERENMQIDEKYKNLKDILVKMKNQYIESYENVKQYNNPEYIDFHARRLVEMIGYIVIGHLLIENSSRNEIYTASAKIMVKKGLSEVAAAASMIACTNPDDLDNYSIQK